MPGTLTLACPAKLNVFLEILGKRPDRFHELETVMLRTQFADQLSIRRTETPGLTLRFSESTPADMQWGIPLDDRNLILRAAEALRQSLGELHGAEFILHKRIPPESGLGGGSSNAASALLLCRQLWQPNLDDSVLHDIAASLGSDINFLLSGYPAAVCRGRGEIIEPISLSRRFSFVAVRPSSGNSTASVFRDTSFSDRPFTSEGIVKLLTGSRQGDLQKAIFNRLTEAAVQINSDMNCLMQQLRRRFRRPVFMSGSGSTVFIVASCHAEARVLQALVNQSLNRPAWLLETPAVTSAT